MIGYVSDIHRSKKYWAKPDEFYPEHFLDENGLLRKNVEGFLPFLDGTIIMCINSAPSNGCSLVLSLSGKRKYLGQNLARVELFLFITYFFQSFNFALCDKSKTCLNGDPNGSLIRWPSPYKVILESR